MIKLEELAENQLCQVEKLLEKADAIGHRLSDFANKWYPRFGVFSVTHHVDVVDCALNRLERDFDRWIEGFDDMAQSIHESRIARQKPEIDQARTDYRRGLDLIDYLKKKRKQDA